MRVLHHPFLVQLVLGVMQASHFNFYFISYGLGKLISMTEHFIHIVNVIWFLLRQGYVMERLKSSLRKFYGRYGDLIKHYEVSFSQMLHDILGHDYIQWHPQLIRHYTHLRIYYRTGLSYRFWPYYRIFEVSIEHCNGCG